MAIFKLSKGGGIIPEGKTVFRITGVDMSDYDVYDKITIEMETEEGQKHSERFTFTKANGDPNEGARNAFSYFIKVALKNYKLDEVDPTEIVGHSIGAEVTHRTYTGRDGAEHTAVNLGRYYEADGADDDGLDDLL